MKTSEEGKLDVGKGEEATLIDPIGKENPMQMIIEKYVDTQVLPAKLSISSSSNVLLYTMDQT